MIEVNRLTKRYKSGKGIFDLDFQVKEGEVFGYLGPNGAGKTTTIRYLLGFTNANAGSARIGGLDCRTQSAQILKTLGYVPGEIAFLENMTGMQFMNFISDLRGARQTKRRDALIERFELENDRKIRKMSKGMKQKVGLITAFMHDPKVLVLDEPTSGLDPLMQKRFVELILEEKSRGKTILMSSHMFEEIERTCDRAGIIRDGRLVDVQEVSALKRTQRRTYIVTVARPEDMARLMASGLPVKAEGLRAEIMIGDQYNALIETLHGCQVTGLDVAAQNLEDIFMQYYGKEAD